MRDVVRAFVARHLGGGGVLIFDETGGLKKGQAAAGTGRLYTGTAGRIENAVVAVYATDCRISDVDQSAGGDQAELEVVDEVRAAGKEHRPGIGGNGRDRVGGGVGPQVRERLHLGSPACATASMAVTMFGYAPQRQGFPLIRSVISARSSGGVSSRSSVT